MNVSKSVLGVLFILCFSCEQELVIESPLSENKPVLNSIFNSGEPFEVELTTTFSPYKEIKVVELKDAVVSIFEEDVFKETLSYQTSTDAHLGKYVSNFTPSQGKNYRIKVTAPNYDEVTAKSGVPSIVHFDKAKIIQNSVWSINNPDLLRYDFSFEINDPLEEDYYYLTISSPIKRQNQQTQEWELYTHQYAEILISNLPDAKLYVNNGLIFTDQSFNGGKFQIKGTATTYVDARGAFDATEGLVKDNSIMEVHLHHLSKEVYFFYISHATSLLNQGDFYSEPGIIYSNITNGFGIFGGEAIEQQ
ncbi:MAG TPA: DUF4249 domain-containing protein [Saprospiraceae bacterium]|nr:DUF4249 domain-containing protein [Saprospiraceae bacterium]